MNWYKRALLEETLPYFQEFEDMGDYVPDENSLNEILENQFGATIIADIGQGDSGVAYLLSNGKVLKITTNKQEGQVANYFWLNPNPHVVNYDLVWREGDLYYIVMEKIDTLAKDDSRIAHSFRYIEVILSSNNCFNVECAEHFISRDENIDESLKQDILSYLNSISGINIPIFDFLNINNVGLKNGKLIFFDIT
jgi:hypothetical protein